MGASAPARAQMDEQPHKDFVRLDKEIPGIIIHLRYNTTNNFVGKRIYNSNVAWVHYRMIPKIKRVQAALRRQGYQLIVWDAYRPRYAQAILYKNSPRPGLVARPGNSRHGRGAAIDIGLADLKGRPVKMPSDFDDPSKKGDHNFSDVSRMARKHGSILRSAMLKNGFSGISHEWWHWDMRGWQELPYIDGPPDPHANGGSGPSAQKANAEDIPVAPAVPFDEATVDP